jgi:hypothetical protein
MLTHEALVDLFGVTWEEGILPVAPKDEDLIRLEGFNRFSKDVVDIGALDLAFHDWEV